MPRIPRVQGLQPLQLAAAPPRTWPPAFRALSTTCAARGKPADWVRTKLWKSEAPGAADPYTEKAEPEDASNLPQEVLEPRPRRDKTPAAVRASRLTLPPRRTEAATEAALKSSDPAYVPATDAQGLEEIGTLKTWWDQPGHWGPESEFRGFASVQKVDQKEVLEVYLRRAVVEVLALQETGAFAQWATKRWRVGDRTELDRALAVEIHVEDGRASLKGDVSSVSQNLTAEAQDDVPPETISPDEAREVVKAWDPSWKTLVLDETAKFAVRKRLYQLTGTLVPDARLGAARTVKHVLTVAAKPPKPPKLAEVLSRRGDLDALANVTVHERKLGPIEKETAIGRWKVIEEELKKRNLPVTGTAGLSGAIERPGIMGKKI